MSTDMLRRLTNCRLLLFIIIIIIIIRGIEYLEVESRRWTVYSLRSHDRINVNFLIAAYFLALLYGQYCRRIST